ncbi:GNAT family N-acetyltransferase [Streptomyces sp. ISL-36]|uniref:GNAT family N-acetyltransferase n=1 Tax=Streptomyces sp. ISL-36 TaxID=2819182 RepID=UPI001BEC8BD1|nr:GNAT family N-acetyltransferase [Streptomyces sp. ISL-36]MBT2444262.1 GNAT family N-acetyltransferase [Streptomyces sp. ISL-36]
MPIREALLQDAAAVAAVHVRSWQAAYRGLFPQSYLDGLDVEERTGVWEARLGAREGPTVLVATDPRSGDGRVVGFSCVRAWSGGGLDPATTGEVAALYTVPEVWGTGVGRGLVDASVEALVAAGFREGALWVLAGNARARGFYEAAGWRADGAVAQDTTAGRTLDELRYRRRLFP